MLKTLNTTLPTLSRPRLAPLNIGATYLKSSTNKFPFQTKSNLNAAANPSQFLYQPHTAPNMGPSTCLLSSSSVPIFYPVNHSTVITQN